MSNQQNEELKNTNYEIFILVLSLLSLVNWVLYFVLNNQDVIRVIYIVDLLLSLIFLADFLYRLFTAESKSRYFFRQLGWLDLLGSLPFPQAKIARLGRVIRAFLLLRELGIKHVLREFIPNRAESAVYIVAFSHRVRRFKDQWLDSISMIFISPFFPIIGTIIKRCRSLELSSGSGSYLYDVNIRIKPVDNQLTGRSCP